MPDLYAIAADLSAERADGPLPVENWHPDRVADMDLVIKADGTWVHEGRPIARPALVRLFSRILRRDEDGFALVTPAEKLRIAVEDAPFLVVDHERQDGGYRFRTNVGDVVTAGPDHPVMTRDSRELGAAVPYLRVRGALDARISRNVYYRLIEEAETGEDGTLFIESGGERFVLGHPHDA